MYPLRPRRINAECGRRQRTPLPGRPRPVRPFDRRDRSERPFAAPTGRLGSGSPGPSGRARGNARLNSCKPLKQRRQSAENNTDPTFPPGCCFCVVDTLPVPSGSSTPRRPPNGGTSAAGAARPVSPPRRGGSTGPDGDPDPTSAGTAGDAALWGGSSAAVGMAANPYGAHQAGRHRAGREGGRHAAALVAGEDVRIPHRAGVCRERRCPAAPAMPHRSRR